jgi:two-component system, cell cycle sensor histidine kinase and response regulator CckA
VFSDSDRQKKALTQYGLVALCVPAWIALVPHIPVLQRMEGLSALIAIVVAAFTLPYGPALLAVALGTVGHELIRPPVPPLMHAQRMLVFAIVGGACVALAYVREARLVNALRYQALFERHPLPMWVFDEETLAFLSVNGAARTTYGYSEQEFRRMTLRDIRPPEELPLLESKPWVGTEMSLSTTRHRTKDGQILDVQIRSQAVPFQGRRARLVLVENVTEQRALEAQLRQAQKMEAIGQLAGGIAHDFNNLLTAIRGYAALVLDSLADDDPRVDDVREIEKAGERATALTRQLLAFSRKQILKLRVISPNDVVQDLAPMLGRLVGEDVRLRTLPRAKGRVKADPAQLEQVIVNLVVNARDAVQSGGEITIETADIELDELYTRTHSSARTGPHVVISVSDNGHGMTPEVQARAFEPFFTTKPTGQGSGLGLATVYGIVKQSGGHVWIYSEVGRGTTVKVYLQRSDESPEQAAAEERRRSPMAVARRTVLLVEDEEGVRSLMQKVLSRAGYTVWEAATLSDVRMSIERDQIRPDIVITDVVLSEGSGRDVADLVIAANPLSRVLYISGYTDDAVVRHGILSEEMAFLQKPFSAAALLENVARILS